MSRRIVLMTLLLVLVVVLAACGSDDGGDSAREAVAPTTFETIDVQTAHNQIGENDQAVFVDVRNPDETAGGYPAGAILIPLPEFAQRAPQELTDKNAAIYVICNSGNRSAVASQTLIDLGYTHVYNVDGGIQAWRAASLPESRP
jgi:rhodanese-related sulfurtransferase